jgi:drug/metabolite transporter (DMT)-like permease
MTGFAVVGAGAFGAADYLGGVATARAGGVRPVLLVAHPVAALALLGVLAPLSGTLPAAAAALGAAAGLAGGAGQVLLYTALARSPVGVGAPICGVLSVAVPVLYAVATGRRTDARDWAGFALLTGAVIALCAPARTLPAATAVDVGAAAGAGVAFGGYAVLLSRTPPASSVWPVVIAHATVAVAVGASIAAGRSSLRPGLRSARRSVVARGWVRPAVVLGLAEAAAAAAVLAAARHDLAVAGAVAAAHPAVTVLLARLLDRERLGPQRTTGLILSFAGVLLLRYS